MASDLETIFRLDLSREVACKAGRHENRTYIGCREPGGPITLFYMESGDGHYYAANGEAIAVAQKLNVSSIKIVRPLPAGVDIGAGLAATS